VSPLRAAAGILCLVLLAVSFAPALAPRAILARLAPPREGGGVDARYDAFLEAVSRATPATATVAVLAPETSERFLRQAAYQLAPRRVVPRELAGEAQYFAVYRRKTPSLPQGAVALPGGFLLTR
jgi:hypothetical protein